MRQLKVEILRISPIFIDFFYRRLLNSRRTYVRRLAAARSHFGSNSPPDCYSLPKCRYTTVANAAFLTAVRSHSRENNTQLFSNTLVPLRYLKSAYPLIKLKRLSQILRQPLVFYMIISGCVRFRRRRQAFPPLQR